MVTKVGRGGFYTSLSSALHIGTARRNAPQRRCGPRSPPQVRAAASMSAGGGGGTSPLRTRQTAPSPQKVPRRRSHHAFVLVVRPVPRVMEFPLPPSPRGASPVGCSGLRRHLARTATLRVSRLAARRGPAGWHHPPGGCVQRYGKGPRVGAARPPAAGVAAPQRADTVGTGVCRCPGAVVTMVQVRQMRVRQRIASTEAPLVGRPSPRGPPPADTTASAAAAAIAAARPPATATAATATAAAVQLSVGPGPLQLPVQRPAAAAPVGLETQHNGRLVQVKVESAVQVLGLTLDKRDAR